MSTTPTTQPDQHGSRLTATELKELATEISKQLQWPAVMTLETAGRYLDRKPEAVRHMVRKGMLPRVGFDSKVQILKADIDALIKQRRF
jgi:hypothetical protein